MLQQFTAMREAVLFKVFLDIQKAYGAVDQERCPELITAYGVGYREL